LEDEELFGVAEEVEKVAEELEVELEAELAEELDVSPLDPVR
jgi:hypothetical protein